MLTKINRQRCLKQFPLFPVRNFDLNRDEDTFFYPPAFASYVLTLPSKSFRGNSRLLGEELTKLMKEINFDTLIFIGDTELPWLYQINDYKPAKEAQQYLIDNKIGRKFSGAIQLDNSNLPSFIKHLSWLTRCNATLPNIHFSDIKQNFTGNICKYGNFHLDTLNEKIDKLFRNLVSKSRFLPLEGKACYNRFGKTSAIFGRKTVI